MVVVALLGLGEAGAAIGADLARAGADVRGWDPREDVRADGVAVAPDPHAAADGAGVVLSLSGARAAVAAAEAVAGALREGQVYADLNTSGARRKREVAEVLAAGGAAFADVALMAPVPGRGLRTPALASGPGAEAFAAALGPLGMPVEVVGGEPGQAAERKLLRSVFMKGLAAIVLEALAAARAAGCEPWLREQMGEVLGAELVDRLESGSRTHAERRVHELEDVIELLGELEVEPRVTTAARGWLEELRDG